MNRREPSETSYHVVMYANVDSTDLALFLFLVALAVVAGKASKALTARTGISPLKLSLGVGATAHIVSKYA
jgi:hypothetical protein